MQADKVLVIIVTYNAMRWIEHCLDSISSFADIFVVDNGSSDGTQDYIKKHYPNVIFRQSKENLGFGAANNVGLQYAIDNNYDYVYLLNQDAWIFPNTLETLIQFNRSNPSFGILSPLQCQRNNHLLDKDFEELLKETLKTNSIVKEELISKQLIQVPRVMAAHWLISKECLLKVGGFSPTFKHYGEDDNYADRAIHHGYKIGIVSKCEAIHDRAERELTKEMHLFFAYTRTLVYLSDFKTPTAFALYGFISDCVKSIFYLKSFKCTEYIYFLIQDFKILKINREKSKATGAFLKNN